jgi:hypothetical protein
MCIPNRWFIDDLKSTSNKLLWEDAGANYFHAAIVVAFSKNKSAITLQVEIRRWGAFVGTKIFECRYDGNPQSVYSGRIALLFAARFRYGWLTDDSDRCEEMSKADE